MNYVQGYDLRQKLELREKLVNDFLIGFILITGHSFRSRYHSGLSDLSISLDDRRRQIDDKFSLRLRIRITLRANLEEEHREPCQIPFKSSTEFNVITTDDKAPIRREWDEWDDKMYAQVDWTTEDKANSQAEGKGQ